MDVFIPGSADTQEGQILTGAVETRHIGEGQLSSSHFSDGHPAGRYVEHTLPRGTTVALFATPYTLVPAPGSGSYTDFLGATLYHDFDNAAFNAADGGTNLVISLGGNGAGQEMTELARFPSAGFLDQSASLAAHIHPDLTTGSSGYLVQQNQPVILTLSTAGLLGGGTSKLRVRAFYRTLTGSWIAD